MEEIIYIRLTTGDEIVASKVAIGSEIVSVRDPMVLEYIELKTGANHPFMTRYDPYADDHNTGIVRSHIIFMKKACPEMSEYYKTSVKYAEDTCDKLVTDRLIEADQYIREADTPSSPVTTKPQEEEPEFNPNIFPHDNNLH